MADGIRIQPQQSRIGDLDVRGRLIVVRDLARPIDRGRGNLGDTCGVCGVVHDHKTYHFQLDQDGTIIVSTTIWDRLQNMVDHGGFEKVNVVSEPPTQGISLTPISRPLELPGSEG